jgi:hypothetical protein
MDFLKPGNDKYDDTDREVTGLFINATGPRKYLAVCEKDSRSGHIFVNIYDFRSKTYKKQIDMTEAIYGHAGSKGAKQFESKANTGGTDGGEDQREPSQRVVVSIGFSKDSKTLAVVMSDQYLDTKAILYDWF